MRKIVLVSTLVVMIFLLILIVFDNINNKPSKISAENVIKITISVDGSEKLIRTTEDKALIKNIINHMNGLHLKRTHIDVSKYDSSSFVINLYLNDGSMKEYIKYGNKFYKESGKGWYRIPYKGADKFYSIYNSMDK